MKSIKKARKICNITQTEFAACLNMDQSNYCNIENGKMLVNSLPSIKKRAIDLLIPKLDSVLAEKEKELSELKQLRESLYNER